MLWIYYFLILAYFLPFAWEFSGWKLCNVSSWHFLNSIPLVTYSDLLQMILDPLTGWIMIEFSISTNITNSLFEEDINEFLLRWYDLWVFNWVLIILFMLIRYWNKPYFTFRIRIIRIVLYTTFTNRYIANANYY